MGRNGRVLFGWTNQVRIIAKFSAICSVCEIKFRLKHPVARSLRLAVCFLGAGDDCGHRRRAEAHRGVAPGGTAEAGGGSTFRVAGKDHSCQSAVYENGIARAQEELTLCRQQEDALKLVRQRCEDLKKAEADAKSSLESLEAALKSQRKILLAERGQPAMVLIDDSLFYSDPHRMERMCPAHRQNSSTSSPNSLPLALAGLDADVSGAPAEPPKICI